MTADELIDLRPAIIVSKEARLTDFRKYIYPPEYEGHFSSIVLEAEEIRGRVQQLAQLICFDYQGLRPVLLCTLKGACPFFIHLSEALQSLRHGYDVEFIRASSYEGTASTGDVVFGECKLKNLQGRHLIIIEDIVDTGTTLDNMIPMLHKSVTPSSVEVCTLLDKRISPTKKLTDARYCGFSIPDFFIVGYGLDYNELYRDLKDIFVISKKGIEFNPKSLYGKQS